MTFDLGAALPHLLPRAVAWAEAREKEIQAIGDPLNDHGLSIARKVGVLRPELIRVQLVDGLLPVPEDEVLLAAGTPAGLFGEQMTGITLGYGICIRKEYCTIRLLSHEARHVYQYETAGGIASFLPLYLGQVAEYGYRDAPYEIDARSHEILTI